MKNSFLFYAIVALAGMGVMVGAKAVEDSVTATVTAQNIAISLSQSTFAYGTIANNTASSTLGLFAGAGIVATNDGNINEDFDINGADTAGWILAGAAGSNQYIHQFCNDTDNVEIRGKFWFIGHKKYN